MTRTYLVAVEVDAGELDADISEDIQTAVESAGFLVESVKPWAQHNSPAAMPQPQPQPNQPIV